MVFLGAGGGGRGIYGITPKLFVMLSRPSKGWVV